MRATQLVSVSLLALNTRGEGRVKIKFQIFWLTFVGGNYNFYNLFLEKRSTNFGARLWREMEQEK